LMEDFDQSIGEILKKLKVERNKIEDKKKQIETQKKKS